MLARDNGCCCPLRETQSFKRKPGALIIYDFAPVSTFSGDSGVGSDEAGGAVAVLISGVVSQADLELAAAAGVAVTGVAVTGEDGAVAAVN